MTARDLQVGDVIRQRRGSPTGDYFYELVVEKRFLVFVKFDRWHTLWRVWRAILAHPDFTSVHRPQPDGTMLQVFPGVE